MSKKFYLTTAIAYASAIPHIGNVYEVILADAIARFKRLDGYDVFFQTGTDEHGQKIENNAILKNQTPKEYASQISSEIKRIYNEVGISYDQFVRTTDERHIKSVQAVFKKLYDQGDIYLGEYEGWYSVADESFILEKDIVDGKAPSGDTPVWTKEETYFLKLSRYQDRLIKHINENPKFIEPKSRRNEMMQNFLKEPIPDLAVSRTSFKWGVPVEFDKGHVVYVWIDALNNYITGLDYNPNNEPSSAYKKYWPADVHLIGKDILRFHTIYWPIMLMALGLELPLQIFGHPWILFNKGKMSKSVGNVMYTDELIKHFDVDVIRYYVLHEISYAQDGNITYESIIERSNSDLANTIGNLVNRTIGMVHKYRQGFVKRVVLKEPFELNLEEKSLELLPNIRNNMEKMRVADALEEIVKLARFSNKYIDVSKPWVLFRGEEKAEVLDHVLYRLLETIRYIAVTLQPFLPQTAQKIARQLGIKDLKFSSLDKFGNYKEQTLGSAKVLFERYDIAKKMEDIEKL